MATNEHDGPLSRLMRGLGLDADLPAIAAVKRIDVMPRRLNAPGDYTNTEVNAIIDEGKFPALNAETLANGRHNEIDLRDRDIRYEFHGTFRGKQQWSCWDANTYDGDESDMGLGDSKEMALVDLMDKIGDEPEPRTFGRIVNGGGGSQPAETEEIPYRDPDSDFDADLEDDLS